MGSISEATGTDARGRQAVAGLIDWAVIDEDFAALVEQFVEKTR